MTSKAQRRRRNKSGPTATRLPTGSDRDPVEPPAWQDDPRECVRRSEPFAALELCGAITREQREAGDLLVARYRLAATHMPALVGSYGERGGQEVDEGRQQAARVWVRLALRLAGPAAALLEALAIGDRPRLTEVDLLRLRAGLDAIR